MRDQPKTTGEWTTESVSELTSNIQGALACRMIADAHNAALAGKQEFWDACEVGYESEIQQLQQQLTAEREELEIISRSRDAWQRQAEVALHQLATEREKLSEVRSKVKEVK